jgi:hypothetical protein
MTKPAEAPEFLFERRPDVEVERGLLLAGLLTIDIPKEPLPPEKRHVGMIDAIVERIVTSAVEGDMPADGLTVGWHGDGAWPPNPIDIEDDDAVAEWRERSLTFFVRVVKREDGTVRAAITVPLEDEDERPTFH